MPGAVPWDATPRPSPARVRVASSDGWVIPSAARSRAVRSGGCALLDRVIDESGGAWDLRARTIPVALRIPIADRHVTGGTAFRAPRSWVRSANLVDCPRGPWVRFANLGDRPPGRARRGCPDRVPSWVRSARSEAQPSGESAGNQFRICGWECSARIPDPARVPDRRSHA